jgi:alcohol dehydrogenase (cytochrome c)
LNQITSQNVKNLRVKWLFQGRHIEKFETTPLVVDGIMYLTRPENAIYALDAVTAASSGCTSIVTLSARSTAAAG